MNPFSFLLVVLGITGGAGLLEFLARAARRRNFQSLAAEWRMQYIATDRLRLAERVAPLLPTVGAADVRVLDVLYRTDGPRRSYLLTAEYGRGVVTAKVRVRRAVGFDEPVGGGTITRFRVGVEGRPLVEQYRALHEDKAEPDFPVPASSEQQPDTGACVVRNSQ